jgi:hypothetical protein
VGRAGDRAAAALGPAPAPCPGGAAGAGDALGLRDRAAGAGRWRARAAVRRGGEPPGRADPGRVRRRLDRAPARRRCCSGCSRCRAASGGRWLRSALVSSGARPARGDPGQGGVRLAVPAALRSGDAAVQHGRDRQGAVLRYRRHAGRAGDRPRPDGGVRGGDGRAARSAALAHDEPGRRRAGRAAVRSSGLAAARLVREPAGRRPRRPHPRAGERTRLPDGAGADDPARPAVHGRLPGGDVALQPGTDRHRAADGGRVRARPSGSGAAAARAASGLFRAQRRHAELPGRGGRFDGDAEGGRGRAAAAPALARPAGGQQPRLAARRSRFRRDRPGVRLPRQGDGDRRAVVRRASGDGGGADGRCADRVQHAGRPGQPAGDAPRPALAAGPAGARRGAEAGRGAERAARARCRAGAHAARHHRGAGGAARRHLPLPSLRSRGAGRTEPVDPGRAGAGCRRRLRVGQEHARPADPAPARARAGRGRGRRRRSRRGRPGLAAPPDRRRPAGGDAVQPFGPREPGADRSRRAGRADRRGGEAGGRARLHPGAAGRLRDRDRRARHAPVGRPAPAPGAGPRPGHRSAHPDPGRGDQLARLRVRGDRPPQHAPDLRGAHGDRDRAPPRSAARGRPHRGAGAWHRRRGRDPCRAGRRRWPLRPPARLPARHRGPSCRAGVLRPRRRGRGRRCWPGWCRSRSCSRRRPASSGR